MRKFALNIGPQDIYPVHAFQLRKGPTVDDGYELIKVLFSSSDRLPLPVLTSQRWPPAKRPYTFKISRVDSRLAGALLLERIGDERLVIMLGSTAEFGVGFDIASMLDIESLEELQSLFNPQMPGTNMVLKNHQVRVNADPQIHHGAKYYMEDIVVEALYPAPNPIGMIREIIPGLQNQSEGHSPMARPSRGLRKYKIPWRSPRIQGRPSAPVDV